MKNWQFPFDPRRILTTMQDFLKKVPDQKNSFFQKFPDALLRIIFVFAVFIFGAMFIIKFIIPPPLKDTNIQWAATEEREAAKEIRYAGAVACAECHEDEYALKKTGYHRNLSCETCHGPAYGHTQDPDEVTPQAPRERKFCPLCHTYNQSRPRGFPQINPAAHNPLKPCISCHDPHDPKPPTIPKECSACHGDIARTKSLSHHVTLECTTCHNVPEKHKVSPRSYQPSKPDSREFCGKCHGPASKIKGPPKVDLETHGEKYLCWQCHYPHLPEVE